MIPRSQSWIKFIAITCIPFDLFQVPTIQTTHGQPSLRSNAFQKKLVEPSNCREQHRFFCWCQISEAILAAYRHSRSESERLHPFTILQCSSSFMQNSLQANNIQILALKISWACYDTSCRFKSTKVVCHFTGPSRSIPMVRRRY